MFNGVVIALLQGFRSIGSGQVLGTPGEEGRQTVGFGKEMIHHGFPEHC